MKSPGGPGTSASGPRPGRRFHLVERLGAGAFGEVYLAEQDSGAGFKRRVALKLLAAQVAHHGEAGRRMRDEARILGRLAHRHIVSVLDLVQLGASWAVVMDYVPGADLDRVLEALERSDAYLSPNAALEIGAAVAEAIDHAYHVEDDGRPLRVLHRDIKPGNVLLTHDGDVKVLDFGVARMNLDTRESLTGVRVGTERYMSPQRIVGDDDDLAGDIYALCASVAELVLRYPIGKTPVAPDRHAAFVATTTKSLRDMLAWHDAPPADAEVFVHLIEAGLAEDPSVRPTARVLADQFPALARAIPGEPLVAFARRFVPTVDTLLGREREVVDGILSEGSTLPSPGVSSFRSEDSATRPPEAFAHDGDVTPIGAPPASKLSSPTSSLPPPPDGPSRLWLGLAAVGLLLSCVAVGLWAWPRPEPVAVPTAPKAAPVTGAISVDPPTPPVEVAPVATEPTPAEPMPAAPAREPTARVRPPATPPPTPSVAADAPRIARALVVAKDASAVRATCGDVSAEGSTSASVRKFPAGKCQVSVTWLGKVLGTEVVIDRAREVSCQVDGDRLTCR